MTRSASRAVSHRTGVGLVGAVYPSDRLVRVLAEGPVPGDQPLAPRRVGQVDEPDVQLDRLGNRRRKGAPDTFDSGAGRRGGRPVRLRRGPAPRRSAGDDLQPLPPAGHQPPADRPQPARPPGGRGGPELPRGLTSFVAPATDRRSPNVNQAVDSSVYVSGTHSGGTMRRTARTATVALTAAVVVAAGTVVAVTAAEADHADPNAAKAATLA